MTRKPNKYAKKRRYPKFRPTGEHWAEDRKRWEAELELAKQQGRATPAPILGDADHPEREM